MKKPVKTLKKFVKKILHRGKSSTAPHDPPSAPGCSALSPSSPSTSGPSAPSNSQLIQSPATASTHTQPIVSQPPSSTGRQRIVPAREPEIIGPPGPINNLPGEILFAIFVACAPSKYLSHDEIIRGRYSPWPISQVSSSWRAFSLATPELWSTIIYNTGNVRSIESTRARAELILERSQTLPLTVKLYCTRHGNSWVPQPHPIVQVLMKAVDRWERLDLAMTLTMLFELASLQGLLSHLKHLSIGIVPSNVHTPLGMFHAFDDLQSLCTVDLTNGEEVLSRVDLPPWNITTFNGRCTPATFFFLAQCINVTTCTLEPPLKRRRPEDTVPTVHLPFLRNLEVCCTEDWGYRPFPISTHNPIHLTITLRNAVWVAGDIAWSLKGSPLDIKSLSIRLLQDVRSDGPAHDQAAALLSLLRAAPGTRKLEICTKRGIMYNFLEALIPASISHTATRYDILSLEELVLKGVYDPRLCLKLLTARFCTADANRLFGSESDTAHGLLVEMVMTGQNAHRLVSAERAKIDALRRNGILVILEPRSDRFN
ncbi:hypothetical protein FPV67DRAFT_1505828 [Lyophyllum atratum]|nr:hypothetical protein FPV67DRAFT_1505828 [Lyophyllum atratum]